MDLGGNNRTCRPQWEALEQYDYLSWLDCKVSWTQE